MRKILVTGATGFIGKIFIPYLLAQGISVRVLVRAQRNDLFSAQVEQFIGDLTQPASLLGVADNVDTVFHLAAYAHAWKENGESAEHHKKINFLGTQYLLEECIRAKVNKFILFSTIKAVGDATHAINEEWEALPTTPYGQAKRDAENLILKTGVEQKIHVCVLRLALVYGPELKGNLLQMLRAIDKKYFLSIPPVKNYRSLVSVYDVCQAGWLAAQSDKANGKIYYVTDKEDYSTYQIYLAMRTALGRLKPRWYIPIWIFKILASIGDIGGKILKRRLPFDSQAFHKLFGSSQYSSLRIQQELGFTPEYPLTTLLPEIVKSYRQG